MSRKFWNFSDTGGERAELYISGELIDGNKWVYDFYEVEATDKGQFMRELRALGDKKEIDVYINSPGGDLFAGLAIHNALKRHQARVCVTIDGYAASAATLIAMAGDVVKMPVNASILVHNALLSLDGAYNKYDLEKLGKTLDDVDRMVVATYREKTGMDDKKILELLKEERFLSAKEAKGYGLIDEILYDYDVDIKQLENLTIINRVVYKKIEGLEGRGKEMEGQAVQNSTGQAVQTENVGGAVGIRPDNSIATAAVPAVGCCEAQPINAVLEVGHSAAPAQPENTAEQERARLQAIDAIADGIDQELVNEAKYGEQPMTAEQLAYRAIAENKMVNRMAAVIAENAASGVQAVAPSVGQQEEKAPLDLSTKEGLDGVVQAMARMENQKRMGGK